MSGIVPVQPNGLRAGTVSAPGQKKMDVPAQAERANLHFFHLLFFAGFQCVRQCLFPLVRVIFFTHFANSNVTVCQNHPHGHTGALRNIYQLPGHSLAQSS